MSADVAILLIVADDGDLLEHSLAAALGQEGVSAEVLVIDNAAGGQVAALCERESVRRLGFESRVSYARAYNEALRDCRAPAVLTLNADCFLEPHFCAVALEALRGERVGAVQGKLLRASGPGPGGRTSQIDSVGLVFDRRHRNSIAGHGRPATEYTLPGPVFGPDGAAALYRRAMLTEVAVDGEVLDEAMEMYATDADLAWRARLQGWRAVFEPQAVAYHVRSYSPSTRQGVPEANRRQQFRNRYLMMLKNESAATLGRHLPWIAGFELLALGHVIARERFLAGGYVEALRLGRQARRRRRAALARRTADASEIAPFLAGLAPSR